MACRFRFLVVVFLSALCTGARATEIPAIAYHDIVAQPGADPFAVTRAAFLEQMAYLAEQGYTPVSLAQLEAARQGRAALPPRPVLLSFDDGLKSFREIALPILARYGYPAVLSVVTAWADGHDVPPAYRGRVMSWSEIREVARSPLVEVISHSHDWHRLIPSDPQGGEAPAGVTRRYDAAAGGYESEEKFRERIRADLARTRERLRAEIGSEPMGIAWPYGEYDGVLIEEAARLGMRYHLTLDPEPNTLETLPRINRGTFYRYRSLADLSAILSFRAYKQRQWRFVRLEMDLFAGRSRAEQEQLLSRLLARLELLSVNAVLIAPLSRDGRRAYFANPVLPVETDLLNHILQRIAVKNGIAERWLEIAAPPPGQAAQAWRSLHTELVRRNRFTAVVLTGADHEEAMVQARALFGVFRPNLKVGVRAPAPDAVLAQADFILWPLEVGPTPGAASLLTREAARAHEAKGPPILFLLRRSAGLDDARLGQAMRALRSAGARHYGYENDDPLAGSPDVHAIGRELRAHTIARME